MTANSDLPNPADSELGFTGVDWSERPVRKLAGDLFAGTGPISSGELAAHLYASVPEIEEMAFELRSISQFLTAEILISVSPHIAEYGEALALWLEDLAEAARTLATDAADHAESIVVARAEMPGAVEMESIDEAFRRLEDFGAGIAGAITGATHELETRRTDAARAASDVMRRFEARTETLARSEGDSPFSSTPRLIGWQEADRAKAEALSALRTQSAEVGARNSVTRTSDMAPIGAAVGALPSSRPSSSVGTFNSPPRGTVKIAGELGTQVRPASLTSAVSAPSAGIEVPANAGAGSSTARGAAAPLAAPISAARGQDNDYFPDVAVQNGPAETRRVSDLYGLEIAVAPSVIGATAEGGER